MIEPLFEDAQIVCRACDTAFIWTASEQNFYADKQLSPPKKCRECRERAKREREDSHSGASY